MLLKKNLWKDNKAKSQSINHLWTLKRDTTAGHTKDVDGFLDFYYVFISPNKTDMLIRRYVYMPTSILNYTEFLLYCHSVMYKYLLHLS